MIQANPSNFTLRLLSAKPAQWRASLGAGNLFNWTILYHFSGTWQEETCGQDSKSDSHHGVTRPAYGLARSSLDFHCFPTHIWRMNSEREAGYMIPGERIEGISGTHPTGWLIRREHRSYVP